MCAWLLPLLEVLPGDTETRLFLARFDCWGVGEWRVFGGGLAGGDGLCLRLGGLVEGDNLRVFRGGLDVLFGGFFGGDRERDEDDEELLPDKDADERRLLWNKVYILIDYFKSYRDVQLIQKYSYIYLTFEFM